jgi:hypothetical protein
LWKCHACTNGLVGKAEQEAAFKTSVKRQKNRDTPSWKEQPKKKRRGIKMLRNEGRGKIHQIYLNKCTARAKKKEDVLGETRTLDLWMAKLVKQTHHNLI